MDREAHPVRGPQSLSEGLRAPMTRGIGEALAGAGASSDGANFRRRLAQNLRTVSLFGVDYVPTYQPPNSVDIGRRGVFGNPFRARPSEKFQGRTLEPYTRWLFAAIKREPWALAQYEESLGRPLPDDFAQQIRDLDGLHFWCPGCKLRTEEENVCHGWILRRCVVWLNGPEGASYVK